MDPSQQIENQGQRTQRMQLSMFAESKSTAEQHADAKIARKRCCIILLTWTQNTRPGSTSMQINIRFCPSKLRSGSSGWLRSHTQREEIPQRTKHFMCHLARSLSHLRKQIRE